MVPKAIDQSKNKWSNDQIVTLIDAYKLESCLYAVNSANYHNKHLRSESLKRVGDVVRAFRPDATDKECTTKFHTLRTQYNIESAKVRASVKSGTGTDNIYISSLWYYQRLKFLDAYFTPRISRSSVEVNTEEALTQDSQSSIHIISDGFTEDGSLNVFLEGDSADTAWDVHLPPPQSAQCSSAASAPVRVLPSPSSSPSPRVLRPSESVSPATSASSSVPTSYQPRAAKRKAPSEDSYVGAIASLAQSLREPIVISNKQSDSTPVLLPVEDGIAGYLTFLGSVIRSIRSEELRFDLMSSTLIQTTINARTLDLDRSRDKP